MGSSRFFQIQTKKKTRSLLEKSFKRKIFGGDLALVGVVPVAWGFREAEKKGTVALSGDPTWHFGRLGRGVE